jgi:hypothetical protein
MAGIGIWVALALAVIAVIFALDHIYSAALAFAIAAAVGAAFSVWRQRGKPIGMS